MSIKRQIKVLNMSYHSTEKLKKIVEELSKVELYLPEVLEGINDIVLEDDNLNPGHIFIKSRIENNNDISILKELMHICDKEEVEIILKPESNMRGACSRLGFENREDWVGDNPEMISGLYEVSQINEVNREGAAQILAKYRRYKENNNLRDGDNLVLDELENELITLYNSAFHPQTIKEAENNASQIKLLHKIINKLSE